MHTSFPKGLEDRCSRRTALATWGAVLGSRIPWPAAIRASDRPRPDFSFVVVSDTHLGRDNKPDAADLWAKIAAEINAAPADFVLHLGDIVDDGREKHYDVYKDIRKSIRIPVHEIPGNHDQVQLFTQHVRADVDTAFDHQNVRFLLLNNCRFKSPNGFVTDQQLKWLQQQCDDAATKNRSLILAMHVPIHENRRPDPGAYVLPADGQTALYRILTQHKDRILATFHGHLHCGLRGWDDHVPLHEIVFPSALFNMDFKITELKAPGYNLTEFRPGYTRVKLNHDGLTLTYHPVGSRDRIERLCRLTQLNK